MFKLDHAVDELVKAWSNLDDVDRAVRIEQILDAGMSRRALARTLGCSENLIRHLRIAADATDEEKQQAGQGELSTRQLVAIVLARRKEQEKTQQQLAAQEAATTIVNWLLSELGSACAEKTLDEANRSLAKAEREGTLPKDRAPVGMSIEEIVARWRPKNLLDDSWGNTPGAETPLARYADWLAIWEYYAFPDKEVRHEAYRLAKSQLEKHAWVPPFARKPQGSAQ